MKALFLLSVIVPLAFAAGAKGLDCSVPVKHKLDVRDYERLARVTEPEARKTALDQVKAPGAAIQRGGGLEVEEGCLIYSYDIQVAGRKGVEEVVIDAGTGKVLKTEHESALKEKAERAAERMNGGAPRR